MTALTKDRPTIERPGARFEPPVAAGARIFAGGLVCLNAGGFAVKGQALAGLVALGRADQAVDNSAGLDGDVRVPVSPGTFRWENGVGADAITAADVGGTAWIIDDQTVGRTPGTGARSPAGVITGVDAGGVWVMTEPGGVGAGRAWLPVRIASLAASGSVARFVAPVAGAITRIHSVLGGALVDGDATLTAKIGATAVTGGVVTIAQAGSAAGDVDAATPSAANVVAAGDVVSLTVGGTNTASVGADVMVEITY